jgi:hypothetical protein
MPRCVNPLREALERHLESLKAVVTADDWLRAMVQ